MGTDLSKEGEAHGGRSALDWRGDAYQGAAGFRPVGTVRGGHWRTIDAGHGCLSNFSQGAALRPQPMIRRLSADVNPKHARRQGDSGGWRPRPNGLQRFTVADTPDGEPRPYPGSTEPPRCSGTPAGRRAAASGRRPRSRHPPRRRDCRPRPRPAPWHRRRYPGPGCPT